MREPARASWGIRGRLVALELNDGSRLEYLYLLTTSLGQTYLLAEYSYG